MHVTLPKAGVRNESCQLSRRECKTTIHHRGDTPTFTRNTPPPLLKQVSRERSPERLNMGLQRVAERTSSGLVPLQGRYGEEAPKARDDKCPR